MKTLIAIALLSVSLFSQTKNGVSVSTTANDAVKSGVSVSFSYALPADDPTATMAANFPAAAPAKTIWLWGDEEPGAKQKDYTESVYGTRIAHFFAKPGTYGVQVIVVDRKNRNIRQVGVKVKINVPVEVE
jgi:hypothetical protein